ncbi:MULTISPECIES: hypothetical protein [unclassified Haloferax]|uniref:hypothetical protein n=1 Tax=unclassified Haloferax TaxID=2625095 RepID=UPI0028740208|nr:MULTISPECIES: hypothetical protein [unclassified Haloferax]MDS0243398.1 hypothetical protein [Haloferax sp. S2CR25]MDS0446519.1 hypothetical protein [Haloferax sp. S2CR25-2]
MREQPEDVDLEKRVNGRKLKDWFEKLDACPYCGAETVGHIKVGLLKYRKKCYSCNQRVKVNGLTGDTEALPRGKREVTGRSGKGGWFAKQSLSSLMMIAGIVCCITIIGIPVGIGLMVASVMIARSEDSD